ncbi:hypothetical protein CDL12_22406 [Handroanthus impetiginosus]|uniref:Putative plant transposon protein domain-containing protein n=1 Tax=Handroanthus impetiginosus TaxID=429701 RepID=A0A2G9GID0_9LAMI|nr:hypothetical protein CDL12_22406 [Handroanthus impetiginosus]
MLGRRTSKRRQTNIASSSQDFDRRQFISQEVEDYYNGRLADKAAIRERGIQGVDEIAKILREFYANLKFTDQRHYVVLVRTLSRLNKPIHFFHTKLTVAADHWLRFISTRLLPTTHTSDITKERAVMIFAILTDVPFDIGRFLHRSIWNSAMGGLTVGLYHPSLIIPGNELLQLDSMISVNRRPAGRARALVQPHQRQPPALGFEERVYRLMDEFAYQQQLWALWANQMNILMSSRPHYPPDELAGPPIAELRNE